MISVDRGLTQRAERYLLARDVSVGYAEQIRQRVAAFCEHVGCDIREDGVTAELVNEWLAQLQASGSSPHTVCGYRRAILAVVNDEEETCGTKLPFLRLRRIKKPRCKVVAYRREEIKSLIEAASLIGGRFSDGRRQCDYWASIIEAAYSTGLRRGDLLRLPWSDIGDDGTIAVVQHKTNYPLTVRITPDAMGRIRRLDHPHGLAFHWPHHLNHFSKAFHRIRKKAEVKRGQFKWLRRSAGSYAELANPGMGHLALGHRSDKCFKASYEDLDITRPAPVSPPPL